MIHQKKIAGFDVSMHDAASMGHIEGTRDESDERNGFVDCEPIAVEPLGEVLAFEPFHDQIWRSVGHAPMLYMLYDMGVIECGKDARFVEKPGDMICIGFLKHFDGDRFSGALIQSSPYGAHAA